MDGTEVVRFGVDGGGEPVPKLMRHVALAEVAGYFFGDVVCGAVPGKAAGKIKSGAFRF